MLRRFMAMFLKGFFALLPLLLSIYVLSWLFGAAEAFARKFLLFFLPEPIYVPGFGILVSLILISAFGLFMERTLARRLMAFIEELFTIMPLVRTVYRAIKDFTSYLAPSPKRQNSRVVVFRLPNSELELVGLVTKESLEDLPPPLNREQSVAVYLPMSYQFGGYTIFVPRSQIRELHMGTEQAMRSVLTAWMSGATETK